MIQAVTPESDFMYACGEFFENFWPKRIFCGAAWFYSRLASVADTYVRTYDTLISARKLAEVAGHGILIVLGGGDVASQCVSKFSCCRDLHPGRQIGSLSSSNVEKTHVFITLPSTNFRTI